MQLYIAIQAGKPDNKAVFQAQNLDEARIEALSEGYIIVGGM